MTNEERYCQMIIEEAEKKLGKPLNEEVIQGIRNCGSLMFLEVVGNELHFADTPEKLEKWQNDLRGFKR